MVPAVALASLALGWMICSIQTSSLLPEAAPRSVKKFRESVAAEATGITLILKELKLSII